MSGPTLHWDFFIAYAGPDWEVADDLYDRLSGRSRPFKDDRSYLLGDDWSTGLPRAQRESKITLVLASKNTGNAYYQREEIAGAIAMARKAENSHRVVPIYIDTDEEDGEIPYGLRILRGVKLSDVDGLDGLADVLLDLLRQHDERAAIVPDIRTLGPSETAALSILQHCAAPLPSAVVQAVVGGDVQSVIERLGAILDRRAFAENGDLTLSGNLTTKIARDDSADLLAKTLLAILAHIRQHKSDPRVVRHLDVAFRLARECRTHSPHAVRGLFNATDTILKRMGDKSLVFEAAELSIGAARRPARDDEDVKIEAKARICGRSWVYQRTDRLHQALADAEKSLELGTKINWGRNTAFCRKCLGRIYRMLAVGESDEARRVELLKESVGSLKEAIAAFKDLDEFGPDHPEVGDCYSLLAKTYLVAGQPRDARKCLNKAASLLQDQADKDYYDYLIREGDYSAHTGDCESAEGHYTNVIESTQAIDSEKSEIRARAFHQRGLCRAKRGNRAGAISDHEQAERIWLSLTERANASEARWQIILAEGKLSARSIAQLQVAPVTARVLAATMHAGKLSMLARGNSRRTEPDRRYWQNLLREAQQQDALQDIGW